MAEGAPSMASEVTVMTSSISETVERWRGQVVRSVSRKNGGMFARNTTDRSVSLNLIRH